MLVFLLDRSLITAVQKHSVCSPEWKHYIKALKAQHDNAGWIMCLCLVSRCLEIFLDFIITCWEILPWINVQVDFQTTHYSDILTVTGLGDINLDCVWYWSVIRQLSLVLCFWKKCLRVSLGTPRCLSSGWNGSRSLWMPNGGYNWRAEAETGRDSPAGAVRWAVALNRLRLFLALVGQKGGVFLAGGSLMLLFLPLCCWDFRMSFFDTRGWRLPSGWRLTSHLFIKQNKS